MNILQRGIKKVKMVLSSLLSKDCGIYMDLDYKRKLELYHGVRFYSCGKEPETIRWMETFKKDEVVYDIGANIGAYSLVASLYAKEVYAFEPAISNYAILVKNIIHNLKNKRIADNVIPIYNALGMKTSIGTFNYMSLDTGDSCHVLDGTIDYKGDKFTPVFSQKMLALSLDDFVRYFNAPLPNHIKLDVDGNEYDILCGAANILKSMELKSLLVEVDGGKDDKVIKLLEGNGFKTSKRVVRRENVVNYIFRRVI